MDGGNASTSSAAPPPSAWTSGTVAVVVAVVAALSGTLGVLLGADLNLTGSAPAAIVTPELVLVGSAAPNISISSNCDGPSQSSADGYWECGVSLEESGGDHLALLNVTAPLATNLVVFPALPLSLSTGDPTTVQISGQLGYTGVVTVFLGID